VAPHQQQPAELVPEAEQLNKQNHQKLEDAVPETDRGLAAKRFRKRL